MMQDVRSVARPTSTKLLIAWGIIWRMTLWGLGAGMLVGFLYGCAWAFPSGSVYGIAFGLVQGGITGLPSGILMAAIVLVTLPRVHNRLRYAQALAFVPVGIISVLYITLLVYNVVTDGQFYTSTAAPFDFPAWEWANLLNNRWNMGVIYVPGIISMFPAWYAGRRVANWVAGEYITAS